MASLGPNPWAAPVNDSEAVPSQRKPFFWRLYVAYCWFMAVLGLIVFVAGIVLFVMTLVLRPSELMGRHGGRLALFCLIPPIWIALFGAGPYLPRCRRSWYYGLFLSVIGVGAASTIPIALPMLIVWCLPNARNHFFRATMEKRP